MGFAQSRRLLVGGLTSPGNPVGGHGFDIAAVLRLDGICVRDLVEGVEPVVGALGQLLQQRWHGCRADVGDALVRRVSDHLVYVYAFGAFFEPFVGWWLKVCFIKRQVCVYLDGSGVVARWLAELTLWSDSRVSLDEWLLNAGGTMKFYWWSSGG